MRLSARIVPLLGFLVLAGTASAEQLTDAKLKRVFARGRGPAAATVYQRPGAITKHYGAIGKPEDGPASRSLVFNHSAAWFPSSRTEAASSQIGKVIRNERVISDTYGRHEYSIVQRLGSRPTSLKVWRSEERWHDLTIKGEAVIRVRDGKAEVVRNQRYLVLFGKKLVPIGRELHHGPLAAELDPKYALRPEFALQ
jgi:hypothetical protein